MSETATPETVPTTRGMPRDVVQLSGAPRTQRVTTVLFPGTAAQTVVEETLVIAEPGGREQPFVYSGNTGIGPDEADRLRALARGIPYRTPAERYAAGEAKRKREMMRAIETTPVPGAPSAAVSEIQSMLDSCSTPEERKLVQFAWAKKMGLSDEQIAEVLGGVDRAPRTEMTKPSFSAANMLLRNAYRESKRKGGSKETFAAAKAEILETVTFEPYEDQEVVAAVATIAVEQGILTEEEAQALIARAPEPVGA